MKSTMSFGKVACFATVFLSSISCNSVLDEPLQNTTNVGETDYTQTQNMVLPLIGVYTDFTGSRNGNSWEDHLLLAVRGDDVNSGGLGDQQDYAETDKFNYNKDYWMYNSVWQNYYSDILSTHSAMEQIELYKKFAPNPAVADQYIAEAKTIRAFVLLQMARTWGGVFITKSSDPSELLVATLPTKNEVMQHISDQMDEAIANLPSVRPNERTDIKGGVTKFTALAIKAQANLELGNYQAVADATSQIISSNKFVLEPDFYELFKIKGKLNDENLLEKQYSPDWPYSHFDDCYYPENWTPAVEGAWGGWGFYEPSMKFIKFMLTRGETVRLETSVLFTNRGITEIKKDPNFATLPSWISNTTRDGDVINDFARALFSSGKNILPSNQLDPAYPLYAGANKNFVCIRYAEVLLMHAEALTQGASGSGMTALQAVNAVRARASMPALTSVNLDAVMDEKYAEMAMEWGIRFYDMVRLQRYDELSYDGRTFSANKAHLPYPQAQRDILPILQTASNGN
jgi:starch-binding outer membrane protein, SusD/RagB family